MAVVALTAAKVTINSVDMSAFIDTVELDIEADDIETSNFGSGGWRTRIGGMKKGSVKLSFNDDFATTTVDDRLFALFGTVTAVAVKATQAANSASNPEYQFNALVTSMMPLKGKVGELATQDLTWPISGPVTRAVV
jgi:predicted secreted protein